jgi:hypothetical protein
MKRHIITVLFLITGFSLSAQEDNSNKNKFRQLKQELATPNVYRTASGAPGHEYYQQKADYDISVTLNDETQSITGNETITYYNNSPDVLNYLWVQLDQNVRAKDSDTKKINTNKLSQTVTINQLKNLHNDFDGGFKISKVIDTKGNKLSHFINKTMMRINLDNPLKPNEKFSFKISWSYNINNRMEIGGRSGFEYFEKDKNHLYTIAQFYPRMAVYNEVEGWQNKQFLGRGEFTLPFGDFKVNITVPDDHIVGATGVLQNQKSVLSSTQLSRFNKAASSNELVVIVTQDEAEKAEKTKSAKYKTWTYHAKNVRDFAFASSRKFIWDAKAVKFGDRTVMAMSYYPKEGNPLWGQYSTEVVAHTISTYSEHTFDYPYPTAISVHSKSIGMEYPMICFNGGRPEEDGTYSERTKHAMISVIIHEVGHNFFPMIVNSDERQWTWMDEGLNTFVQYLTEMKWDRDYPSRRGPAYKIVDYMKGDKSNITPIMTNSESIFQFGNNAYGKPATALNILRETVLGRELFDYAFKEYCRRWMFKHPTPADFFRTMEDASAVDLDWFWRAWFYTTDHVDLALKDVKWYKINNGDPANRKDYAVEVQEQNKEWIGNIRNRKDIPLTAIERDSGLRDFYNSSEVDDVTTYDQNQYNKFLNTLTEEDKKLVNSNMNYYEVTIEMLGGAPTPIILEFIYSDGTSEIKYIPAEIWRMGQTEVSKVFYSEKTLVRVNIDPYRETADIDTSNNSYPEINSPSRFKVFKSKKRSKYFGGSGKNKMQKAKAE